MIVNLTYVIYFIPTFNNKIFFLNHSPCDFPLEGQNLFEWPQSLDAGVSYELCVTLC